MSPISLPLSLDVCLVNTVYIFDGLATMKRKRKQIENEIEKDTGADKKSGKRFN